MSQRSLLNISTRRFDNSNIKFTSRKNFSTRVSQTDFFSVQPKYRKLEEISDVEFENLIISLKTQSQRRTFREYQNIIGFIEKSDFIAKINKDKYEESLKFKIIRTSAKFLEYLFCPKGDILFKLDDLGDCFFVIIKGEMNILKPQEKELNMTSEQYILQIQKLITHNQFELAKRTVSLNKSIFPVKHQDYDNILNIFALIQVKNILDQNFYVETYFLISILNKYNVNPSKIGIDESGDTLINTEKRNDILGRISKLVDLKYYNYLNDTETGFTVKICYYEKFLTLRDGKYFGDFALDTNSLRTATLQAESDTHLAFIRYKNYVGSIFPEKRNSFLKEVSFLLEQSFLRHIPTQIFTNEYYSQFIFSEHTKGNILFNEGDVVEKIYFIKNGEVNLTFNEASIISIQNLILKLSSLLGIKDKFDFNFNSIPTHQLTKKKKLDFCIYSKHQIIGCEEIFFKINHYYKTVVVTDKTKIYSIKKENFEKMINSGDEVQKSFLKTSKENMNRILFKLKEVRKVLIGLSEMKENKDKINNNFNKNLIFKFNSKINQNIQNISHQICEKKQDSSKISGLNSPDKNKKFYGFLRKQSNFTIDLEDVKLSKQQTKIKLKKSECLFENFILKKLKSMNRISLIQKVIESERSESIENSAKYFSYIEKKPIEKREKINFGRNITLGNLGKYSLTKLKTNEKEKIEIQRKTFSNILKFEISARNLKK